jgi:signal transduction histidine kinase
VPDTFRTASETIAKAITELRSLAKTLDKNWLESFDIEQNLLLEVERINANHNIHASLKYNIGIGLLNDRQLLLYRIIQEGIQNVIKHANASKVCIEVSDESPNNMSVIIADDGVGFAVEEKQGLGLRNMFERAKLLNGSFAITSRQGKGTKIELLIPIDETNK